jgi:hypothetical protein
MMPAFYLIAAAVVSLASVSTLRETASRPMHVTSTGSQVAV